MNFKLFQETSKYKCTLRDLVLYYLVIKFIFLLSLLFSIACCADVLFSRVLPIKTLSELNIAIVTQANCKKFP